MNSQNSGSAEVVGWINWNAHGDGNANVNTVDEQEFISVD